MMGTAFRMFPSVGVAAVFTEPNTTGDALDPGADRNAPAISPEDWLPNVTFSTLLDFCEVVVDEVVTVNHASVSAVSGSTFGDVSGVLKYNAYSHNTTLWNHALGYLPFGKVVVGDNALSGCMPVQTGADGRARYVSVTVDTANVVLREWVGATDTGLSSISLDYHILLLRAPRDASGNVLHHFDPATGITTMGFDRWASNRPYLRVKDDSDIGLAKGRSCDLANGAFRFINPDGTGFEPVQSTLKCRVVSDGSYGASMAYNGSWTGDGAILVSAP